MLFNICTGDLINGLGTTNATDFMLYHNNFYIITFQSYYMTLYQKKCSLLIVGMDREYHDCSSVPELIDISQASSSDNPFSLVSSFCRFS